MKFSVLMILLFFSYSKLFSQSENFESALIPKKDGAVVAYSGNQHSLTLDINSKKIQPLDKPGIVIVDNKTLQFALIGNAALKNDTNIEVQKQQLIAYTKYELDYDKNDLKLDYSNFTKEWLVINNKIYLLWYFDMPVENKSVLKQINLSAVCYGHVLNLNTPFVKDDIFDEDKGLLLKVAQTMKQNDFKIDFDELYKKLNPK